MTDRQFDFEINGRKYRVDNSALQNVEMANVYFEVKKCPKCGAILPIVERECNKCDTPLHYDSIFLGIRKRKSGIKTTLVGIAFLIIYLIFYALASTALSSLGSMKIYALIVLGIIYIVYRILSKLGEDKQDNTQSIIFEELANQDYQAYRKSLR